MRATLFPFLILMIMPCIVHGSDLFKSGARKPHKLEMALDKCRLSDPGYRDERLRLAYRCAYENNSELNRTKAREMFEEIFFENGCYNNIQGINPLYKYELLRLSTLVRPLPNKARVRMICCRLKEELYDEVSGYPPDDRALLQKIKEVVDGLLKKLPISVEPLYQRYSEALARYQEGTKEGDAQALAILEREFFNGSPLSQEATLSVESIVRATYLKAVIKRTTMGYFDWHEVINLFYDVRAAALRIDPVLAALADTQISQFGGVIKLLRLPPYDPDTSV